ncbi:uncharacterized protein pdzph1 [Pungitius pungitius]|uniref:uncharacterized protein pdzph1 n=1 Tax=Pungitius pungitius TaxID=134920 RepID=UPI002E12E774
MSKRGRRRNSRWRKRSSSSKQGVSACSFHKQNKSNTFSCKEDNVEKGETDFLQKENFLSGSEDEEKYDSAAPKDKRVKLDHHGNSFTKQRSIYTKTTEDKEKGARALASVSVNDVQDFPPNIIVQQSCVPFSEDPTHPSAPVTNIMNITMNCSGSHGKHEIQESFQLNTSDNKTSLVLINTKGNCADVFLKSKCEKTWLPKNKSCEQSFQNVTNHNGNQSSNYRFTFGNTSEHTESHCDSKYVPPTSAWDNTLWGQCCRDHKQTPTDLMLTNHPSTPRPSSNIKSQGKRKNFDKSIRSGQFWDICPPKEFADLRNNTLEELTDCLASCRIGAQSPADKKPMQFHANITNNEESKRQFSLQAGETAEVAPWFHRLAEPASYEPMLMRPSLSRSNFTKDFINCQQKKSLIRNNGMATVEHRGRWSPKKRHQTYPGRSQGPGSMQEDLLSPCTKSFPSLVMHSLLLQTEGLGRIHRGTDRFSAFGNDHFPQYKARLASEDPNSCDERQYVTDMTSSEDIPDDEFMVNEQCPRPISYPPQELRQQDGDIKQSIAMDVRSGGTDSDPGKEMEEVKFHSSELHAEKLSHRALAIQATPPSCRGPEEQISKRHPATSLLKVQVEIESPVLPKHIKSLVTTVHVNALRQTTHSTADLGVPYMFPLQEGGVCSINTMEIADEIESIPFGEKTGNASPSLPLIAEQRKDEQLNTARRITDNPDQPAATALRPADSSIDAETHVTEQLSKTAGEDEHIVSGSSKEHQKPVVHRDPDSSGSDHWLMRRKLFKESKERSSAGGSSMTSDITEESVSEDSRSMEIPIQDNEDSGFYTETFHSSPWIYQGDDADSAFIPPNLKNKTRAVSIRERTVKISRGEGEYPWGFRIQFSNPIVVTEVDTNGPAEEAGLMVGDSVLSVNGTDVTSISHSEATDLARQGPDVLTLTIGSDIARGPNTPRPACRGYLYKRTHRGLFKGWRRRWFVLTHDCCLFYHRHKRDERKKRALFAVKLEGAEVGPDLSLGKPFVFKCRPQSSSRVYFLCATSSQEMKRWLEAMEKAIHPITQNHVWVDVTRHNSNLPPLAVKTPECLGLLHKMDKNQDAWVQHYCILKDGCLYLYNGIRASHAHGGIYLQGYMVREHSYGSKKSTIELRPPNDEFKVFHLCAENPHENKRWIIALKASIMKWLPSRSAFHEYMNRPLEETRM